MSWGEPRGGRQPPNPPPPPVGHHAIPEAPRRAAVAQGSLWLTFTLASDEVIVIARRDDLVALEHALGRPVGRRM
jgi:hypothetical protein